MSPAAISVGVTVVVVAVVGAFVVLSGGGPSHGSGRRALPVSPSWLVLGAVLLIVGVIVMPRLLGFMFLLLPMLWSRSARRRPGPGGPQGTGPDRERDRFDEDL